MKYLTREEANKRWNEMIKFYRDYAKDCLSFAEHYEKRGNVEMFEMKLKESKDFEQFANFYETNQKRISLKEKQNSLKIFDLLDSNKDREYSEIN